MPCSFQSVNHPPFPDVFHFVGLGHVEQRPPDEALVHAYPHQLVYEFPLADVAAYGHPPLDLGLKCVQLCPLLFGGHLPAEVSEIRQCSTEQASVVCYSLS